MFRKAAWLAASGMLLAGAAACAQGPANPPPPPVYGYPGYVPPGNNLAWLGMAPNIPDGNAPAGGLIPASGVQSLPNYNGVGPKEGASEPYVVPRDEPPAGPKPNVQPAPPPPDRRPPAYGPPVGCEPACYVQMVPPSEPYTLYEGPRYAAEVKIEETRVWAEVSFIHWWVSRGNAPPLVTTGSVNDPFPAALNQPNTSVLLGGGAIGPNEFSGIQASVGMWLDPEKTQGFELAGFYVGKNSRQYNLASNAAGTPLLGQPVIVAGGVPPEQALIFSQPGVLAGSILVNNIMNFYGAESNWISNAYRVNGWTFDYFAGARYLYLNDNLSLRQDITVLPGGAFFIPFNGVPEPAGSNFLLNDSFNVTNRFYGGQIGARVNWTACNWELGAVMKLGFGATTHNVVIDGSSTLNVGGTTTTVPGGTLAQASNIGQHNSTDFSVVPELNLTVSYQFTRWFRVFAGYNLLYWTNVERAGDQIERKIDFTQVPTGGGFVPGTVGTSPLFPNARSDFWAQGLNLGMEFKF